MKIGDQIRLLQDHWRLPAGTVGTVVKIFRADDDIYSVEFMDVGCETFFENERGMRFEIVKD